MGWMPFACVAVAMVGLPGLPIPRVVGFRSVRATPPDRSACNGSAANRNSHSRQGRWASNAGPRCVSPQKEQASDGGDLGRSPGGPGTLGQPAGRHRVIHIPVPDVLIACRKQDRDRQVGDRGRCTRHRESSSPATTRPLQITGDPGIPTLSILPPERRGPAAPRGVRPPWSSP